MFERIEEVGQDMTDNIFAAGCVGRTALYDRELMSNTSDT